ncbi:NAD(P)H-quinone oxidoreductase subunit L [cyanobiont of Ornithocercus magnificus]|nr:NAD(P)H-quinone oxidoreductase subunit L [cyanobiont of Ornithocercus magnificus]
MNIESFLSIAKMEVVLVFMTYIALASVYLIIIPLSLMLWIQQRLTRMGKIERLVVYSMVFLFFPGMIVFAPFLNFRPYGQGEG